MSYLRATGWYKKAESHGKWSLWYRQDGEGNNFELGVPLSPTLRDFAARMSDALRVLETVEERSQLEIVRDLLVTSADVIRVRFADGELADGSVPLEDGSQYFQKARDLMLAAACAAAKPRAYFPSRKPAEATDYLRNVRLGQTEHGSFVLTILSRVPPSLTTSTGKLFENEEPFERRVTQVLSESLGAVRTAAEDAASTGQVESFVEAVGKGVSANLCDAVAGLGKSPTGSRNIEFSFSWSRSRPLLASTKVPNTILFPADAFPVIQEAGLYLKESSPIEDFEARGPVVKLEKADAASNGKITIHCFVEGQPRKVTIELADAEYHQAVAAHDKNQIVRCSGVLLREGRYLRLREPFDFAVEPEEQLAADIDGQRETPADDSAGILSEAAPQLRARILSPRSHRRLSRMSKRGRSLYGRLCLRALPKLDWHNEL